MFENPRRGRQARSFTTNVPKILDLKSSSEQIFSENWVPLKIIQKKARVEKLKKDQNRLQMWFWKLLIAVQSF